MRKILIEILIVCLLVLSVYMLTKKIELGNIEILGIKEILNKNEELDNTIANLKNKTEKEMKEEQGKFDEAYSKMNAKKSEYDSLFATSTDEQIKAATQFQNYDIEFLWTKFGNYAKEKDLKINIDFNKNETNTSNYDLNFSVRGKYKSIFEFLEKIEDDAELGFKIEDYYMVSETKQEAEERIGKENEARKEANGGVDILENKFIQDFDALDVFATFICKNITINDVVDAETFQINTESTEEDTKDNAEENNESKEKNTAETEEKKESDKKSSNSNKTNEKK